MSCPIKSRQFKWFILPAGLLASVNACFAKISSTVFHVSCEIFCKCLDKDKEDKNGRFLRQERYAGSCQRSFYVGKDVTEEDIKAEAKVCIAHPGKKKAVILENKAIDYAANMNISLTIFKLIDQLSEAINK